MALNIPLPSAPTNEGDLLASMGSINSLHKAQLENEMKRLENKYFSPEKEGKIANQLLENKWYEPKTKSAIALQDAQTGHYPFLNAQTAATARKLNTMTPLEAEELRLKNKFYLNILNPKLQIIMPLLNKEKRGTRV